MTDTIESTFDTGKDGWTESFVKSRWHAEGGDPGGYFGFTSFRTYTSNYFAPAKFEGQQGFYHGTFTLDLLGSFDPHNRVSLVLVNSEGQAVDGTLSVIGQYVQGDWNEMSVRLDESDMGPAAEGYTVRDVVKDIQSLYIQIMHGPHAVGGLDNITLSTADHGSLFHHADHLGSAAALHVPQVEMITGHEHLAIA